MNRLNENEKIFTEEYYQMNYQNKKHASTQYLFTLVVFLFVSAILTPDAASARKPVNAGMRSAAIRKAEIDLNMCFIR